jgi:hypothetical protein
MNNINMPETGQFSITMGGVPISVNYKIHQNKECIATFSYLSKLFEFKMSRWSKQGWSPFVTRFHQKHTDLNFYGQSSMDDDGNTQLNITPDQLTNIIVKSAKDVFKYIDMLLVEHQKQILDYSVWYREKYPNPTTYEEYIQLIACHAIVHSQFMSGSVTWNIVPFTVS